MELNIKRITKMLGLQALGQLIIVAEKLILAPLIISRFGMAGFGEWTLIKLLPSYIQFLDFGVFTVGANRLLVEKADKATEIKYPQYAALLALYIFIVLVLLGVAAIVNKVDWVSLFSVSDQEYFSDCLLLSVFYVGLYLLTQMLYSFWRANLRHVESSAILQLSRLVELVVTILSIFFSSSFVLALTSIVYVRFACAVVLMLLMFRFVSVREISFEKKHFLSEIKICFRQGLSLSVMPFSQVVSAQYVMSVVAFSFGPVIVGAVQTVKILTNTLSQAAAVVVRSVTTEFSVILGNKNYIQAKALFLKVLLLVVLMATAAFVGFSIGYDWIFELWLGQKPHFSLAGFYVFLMPSVFYLLWYTTSLPLQSVGMHGVLGKCIFVNSIFLLGFLSIFAKKLEVTEIFSLLALFEAVNFLCAWVLVTRFWRRYGV